MLSYSRMYLYHVSLSPPSLLVALPLPFPHSLSLSLPPSWLLSPSHSLTLSCSLSLSPFISPQVDWESNGSLVKKLSSIKEDEEGDEEQSSVSRAPRSPRRLTRVLNSPLRSPLLHPRPFRPPSEHTRPPTLQIPVVSFSSAPLELSPRFVDGIETESSVNSSQKFEFSSRLVHSGKPSPGLGNTTFYSDSYVVDVNNICWSVMCNEEQPDAALDTFIPVTNKHATIKKMSEEELKNGVVERDEAK
ncbi:unnamed protein product [Oncorhynchus mykiss]|uniref:Uncharacterized protein n=1 Tax=Oncorhynchus mykiss TaxID=8022 RepID=A0A060YWJ8_ONCMY|nr:unnamed protein product [Oncorhynchus mykiss]